jgi:hypothetical protein
MAINLEGCGSFGRAHPQTVAHVDGRGILGEPHALVEWQPCRIVLHQGREVLIYQPGHAGPVAAMVGNISGFRSLRYRAEAEYRGGHP